MSKFGSAFSRKRKTAAGSLAFVVGAGALLVSPAVAFAAPGDPVNLDPFLQECVNEMLERPEGTPVTEGDLASLTGYLDCSIYSDDEEGITSLDGLEFATGLNELYLVGHSITDISPLANLTNLDSLALGDNSDLSDIDALAGLTNLERLDVSFTDVTDFDAISDLDAIQLLSASGLVVDSFAGIAGLPNLEELELYAVMSTSWGELAGISQTLNYLDVSYSMIYDWTWTDGLEVLSFYADNGTLSDLSDIEGIVGLKALSVSDSNISDVSALADMTSLEDIYLSGNSIADISPLSGLDLYDLNVSGQEVEATVAAGHAFDNPFVGLDGEPVAFTSLGYDAADNTFLLPDAGSFSTTWNVSEADNVSNAFSFSGTYSVEAQEVSDLPIITGVSVSPTAANASTEAVVTFDLVDDAERYILTFENLSDSEEESQTVTLGADSVEGNTMLMSDLQPGTEYAVTMSYEVAGGEQAMFTAPISYTTAEDSGGDELPDFAPALVNIDFVVDEGVTNGGSIFFESVTVSGGTFGAGDVVKFVVDYRLAGSDDEWLSLETAGDNDTYELIMSDIYAGTYEMLVYYVTDEGVSSQPATIENAVITGIAEDGTIDDGTVDPDASEDANAAPGELDANALNNSASDVNMGQAGLLAGGGLMLAAAGALLLGSRRAKLDSLGGL